MSAGPYRDEVRLARHQPLPKKHQPNKANEQPPPSHPPPIPKPIPRRPIHLLTVILPTPVIQIPNQQLTKIHRLLRHPQLIVNLPDPPKTAVDRLHPAPNADLLELRHLRRAQRPRLQECEGDG